MYNYFSITKKYFYLFFKKHKTQNTNNYNTAIYKLIIFTKKQQ